MSKVTFYGLPAWIGAIHGPTLCDWWERDPSQLGWDRSLLRTLDLAKTSSAALAGRIAVSEVDVDDHTTAGGRTTIGPLFPGGAMIGACWVSDAYLARNRMAVPGVPDGYDGHGHEFTVVQYFDGEQQNRRFHGFQANLLQTQSHLSLVQLWHPGTGAGTGKPAGTWWLDLATDADPSVPSLSLGQPAPLYLDTQAARRLVTFDPKLPPFQGGIALL